MRLIQRNLFPRRPPSAKCDGPSILKTSSSSSSSNNPKPSSSVALKALLLQKTQPTTSSSANSNNTLPPSTVNSSAQQPPPPPQALSANLNSSKLPQPHPPPPLPLTVTWTEVVVPIPSPSRPVCRRFCSQGLPGKRAALFREVRTASTFPIGLNSSDQHQDCWTDVEKLVADHVGEILSKWDQIDDEIWAKVVVMERNRRVAKAYARTPVLTIAGGGGSSTNKSSPSSPSSPSTNLVGFNGHRVTLGAFANAHRDRSVRAAIRAAGDGLLVRMDEEGNLLGKRSSERSEVSLLNASDNLKQQQQQQKPAKISAKNSVLLFDMAAFRSALEKEVLGGGKGVRRSFQTSSSPSTLEKVRAALQAQCFVFLGFGNGFSASSNSSSSLLRTPVWAILVNLVALEMLFSSLPSPLFHHLSPPNHGKLLLTSGDDWQQQR
ncbi:hypothetical protein TYRP_019763 [Tyrophagus putrescentiae]|nr:hypothetical protein TYRP_019763 [Tyrophagus putrescentiae]